LPNNKKVIPFRQPETWTFYDWVDANGSNPIEEWLAGESDEVRWKLNSVLKDARKRKSPTDWLSFKRFLKGKCEPERLWELEFKADRRQYRLIGRFDGQMKSIFFCGCYHKESVYTPKEALDTAFRRAKLLSQGKAGKNERKVQDDF
jgi:hypothetical protein